MQNAMGILFAIFLMLVLPGEAKERTFSPIRGTIQLTDLSAEITKEFIAGLHPDIAIRCEAGNELPLKLLYNLHFVSMKFNPNLTIKVERPFYLRVPGNKVYMSTDLVHWENVKNILQGNMDLNIGISPDASHVLIETTLLP